MTRKTTLKDIAKASGYTEATVSYALKGHPKIPLKTRKKIKEIAKKLHWKPNPMVSSWMSHLRQTQSSAYHGNLAFLGYHPTAETIAGLNPFHQKFFRGAQSRAKSLGYQLEYIWVLEPGMTNQRLQKILLSRGIEGLLIGPNLTPDKDFDSFPKPNWNRFALATGGFSIPPHISVPRVATNIRSAIRLALKKCKERYQRIGIFIEDKLDKRVNYAYLDPVYHDLYLKPAKERIPPFTDWSFEKGDPLPKLKKWFQRYSPEVIISDQEIYLKPLHSIGLKPNKDFDFVCLGNSNPPYHYPGIDLGLERAGNILAELVIDQLTRNERGFQKDPTTTLFEGKWVEADAH